MRRLLFFGILACAGSAACGGDAFKSAPGESSAGSGGTSSGGSSGSTGSGGQGGRGGVGGSTGGSGGSAGSSGGTGASGGASGIGGSAGSATGGAGGSGGVGASGGTVGTSGGAGGSTGTGGGSATCDEMRADMVALLDKARQCCLACAAAVQCTGSVPGLCCPQTVNSYDSPETHAYLNAYNAFLEAGCDSGICPAIPCVLTPSYTCTSIGATGRCQ